MTATFRIITHVCERRQHIVSTLLTQAKPCRSVGFSISTKQSFSSDNSNHVSTTNSNTNQLVRKRRRRSRNKKELLPTKRTKLRSYGNLDPPGKLFFNSPNEAIDVMGDRLSKARQFIFSFWRGTTLPETGGPIKSIIENAKSRPPRVGPIMDARWWFANICFALLPATLIGLYCEFVVKDEAAEYWAKATEKQRQRILDEFPDDEDDDNITDKAFKQEAADAVVVMPPHQMTFSERAKRSFDELQLFVSTTILRQEDEPEKAFRRPINEVSSKNRPQENEKHAVPVEPTSPVHKGTVDTQAENKLKVANEQNGADDVDDADSFAAMLRRIDALEKQVEKQKRRYENQKRYQIERTQQTGVRNRIEDQWKRDYLKEQEKQQEVTAAEDHVPDSDKKSFLDNMREKISLQKETAQRYSGYIMDNLQNMVEKKQPEDSNDGSKPPRQEDMQNVIRKQGDSDKPHVVRITSQNNREKEAPGYKVNKPMPGEVPNSSVAESPTATHSVETVPSTKCGTISATPPSSEEPPAPVVRRGLFSRLWRNSDSSKNNSDTISSHDINTEKQKETENTGIGK